MPLERQIPFNETANSGSAATISLAGNAEGEWVVQHISGNTAVNSFFGIYNGTASGIVKWESAYDPPGTLADGFCVPLAGGVRCGVGSNVQIILKTGTGRINAIGVLDPA